MALPRGTTLAEFAAERKLVGAWLDQCDALGMSAPQPVAERVTLASGEDFVLPSGGADAAAFPPSSPDADVCGDCFTDLATEISAAARAATLKK